MRARRRPLVRQATLAFRSTLVHMHRHLAKPRYRHRNNLGHTRLPHRRHLKGPMRRLHHRFKHTTRLPPPRLLRACMRPLHIRLTRSPDRMGDHHLLLAKVRRSRQEVPFRRNIHWVGRRLSSTDLFKVVRVVLHLRVRRLRREVLPRQNTVSDRSASWTRVSPLNVVFV